MQEETLFFIKIEEKLMICTLVVFCYMWQYTQFKFVCFQYICSFKLQKASRPLLYFFISVLLMEAQVVQN